MTRTPTLPTWMLIDGGLVEGLGEPIRIDDPATGELAVEVPTATPEQVDEALEVAATVAADWRTAAQPERTALLRRIADVLIDARQRIAEVCTVETGRPFERNLGYVDWTAELFRFYAELSRVDGGRLAPAKETGQLSLAQRVPYGVVAALTPFNYPLALLAQKLAPALGTGNVVVVKPAPVTTATTLLLGELLADVAPPGTVQVLAGGAAVGEQLIGDPRTDLVAFTGSTTVGRSIGERCGRLAKPTHLELGGNDPAIVLSDVDPAVAGRAVAWAAFLNAGQVCTSTERVYVHRDVFDDVVAEATAVAGSVRVGDPWDDDTQIGPLRTREARDRIRKQLEEVRDHGGEVTGGHVPDRSGYFLHPAVVTGIEPTHPLVVEETFGPVLPVVSVDDLDEALDLAADTEYGLGASLYTEDTAAVRRTLDRLQVGTLWVNDPVLENIGAPFGGMRASGNARELGMEGLHAFTTFRHVLWGLQLEERTWWFHPGEELR